MTPDQKNSPVEPTRGLFVVLEGGEGAGKTTLASALAKRFAAASMEAIHVREPGATAVGDSIRALLHHQLVPWAETFAFLTARAQLVSELIRPALERGSAVICDRFEASTFAYQGYARGLDLARLRAANRDATGCLVADLTILLDIDPAIGLARKHGETEAIRTGLEELSFHSDVRKGYLALAEEATVGTWLKLDARKPANSIAKTAWTSIQARLGRQGNLFE